MDERITRRIIMYSAPYFIKSMCSDWSKDGGTVGAVFASPNRTTSIRLPDDSYKFTVVLRVSTTLKPLENECHHYFEYPFNIKNL
ncbi:hypothetical protein CHS0354_027098 [Potamilus streckersoni]|uniref:Uncharacterized protein n=1 Tax=Potamilus streckersoni TaxID=2493646 RepID=A0AAE0VN94_9BIVA|nr:hypothetical protein CHS0354_027098 [Potamilus streckersoni]